MKLRCCWVLGVALVATGCGDDDDGPPTEDASAACGEDSDCDDGQFCTGQERCDPGNDSADSRGCISAENPPCDDGACDEDAGECTSGCADMDGDGAEDEACGGEDCDDSDPNRYPGNTEVCDPDHVDEDCDPSTFGTRDIDLDGFVDRRCCNGDLCGDDCDETRRGTNPNVPEVCDRRDNDCDGEVDEGLLQASFEDHDRDLHGDPDSPIMACPGQAGVSQSMLDCDDDDTTVNSPQQELIDGEDNDCDGRTDEEPADAVWYPDVDGDGYGDASGSTVTSNMPVAGHAILPIDCDDSDAAISPQAEELCNGIDDNCDGLRDFVIDTNDWEDDDNDGFPDATCAGSSLRADCDDTDPITYPMAEERCDFRDNDCDGEVDEDCSAGCENDAACDDGSFCNGVESCQSGTCLSGSPLTCGGGMRCDEDARMCVSSAGDGGMSGVDAGVVETDAGPPGVCTGVTHAGTSTGSGTVTGMVNGGQFIAADAVAAVVDGPDGTTWGPNDTIVIVTLTDHLDACVMQRQGQAGRGRTLVRAFFGARGASGPPGVPPPGTYVLGELEENVGTPVFGGALIQNEIGTTQECEFDRFGGSISVGGMGTEPVGSITLTQTSGGVIAGSFQFTDDEIDLSGTFSADVCDIYLGTQCCLEANAP